MDKTIRCDGARSNSVTEALERIRILLENLLGQNQEKNKLLVRNFFRAIDAGDPAALDQYISVDYLDHNPQFPNLPSGIEGVRQGLKSLSEPGLTSIMKLWIRLPRVTRS
jgi:hypothetical protein